MNCKYCLCRACTNLNFADENDRFHLAPERNSKVLGNLDKIRFKAVKLLPGFT